MPTITGTSGPDYLVGVGPGDTISGGSGDDTIIAAGSGDTLTGGPGGDTFVFGSGFANGATITDWELGDHVVFSTLPANYRITAVVQSDTVSFGGVQADALAKVQAGFQLVIEQYGLNGTNVAVFVDSHNNHTIADTLIFAGKDLSWFAGGTFIGGGSSGSQLIGDSGPNTLAAGVGNDTLVGRAGNDSLAGGAGDNLLLGEDGDDTLSGGPGNDILDGGAGVDTVSFARAAGGVSVNLTTTTAQQISAGEGKDTIRNVENVDGSPFNDLIVGGPGSNTLLGEAGDDTLVASGLGGAPETLSGGSGANVFDLGSLGHSPAAGGLGGHLDRLDRITDWNSGDVLRFADVAATAANYLEITASSYDDAYARAMAAAQGGAAYIAAQVGPDVIVFDPQFAEAVVLSGAKLTDIAAGNIQSSAPAPAPLAPAQHAPITTDGNDVTGSIVVGATEAIVVTEGTAAAGFHAGFFLDPRAGQPDPTFRNEGSIELDGASGGATPGPGPSINSPTLLLVGTASFWDKAVIENDGRMYVAAVNNSSSYPGAAKGIVATSWSPDILNRGIIEVHGGQFATGIESWDGVVRGPWTFTNTETGKLIVDAQEQAFGIYAPNGGLIVNHGLIQITALNKDDGFTEAVGMSFVNGDGELDNYGVIVATSPDPNVYTSAVALGPYHSNLIVNYGTITAKFAIVSGDDQNGPEIQFSDRVENYGTINGDTSLNQDSDTFINSGVVNGAIDLGSQDDIYDGRFGRVSGLVSGGQGDDVLMGGAGADSFQGNQGNDTENGGGGDDIVVGGKDNDSLTGDAGNDIVWGNLGADTLDGGDGNDQVRGGQGDDSISGGAGNDFISGDRGNDTEAGGPGADTFHGSQDAGIDKVLDFNVGEGDRVMLDPGTTFSVSQVGGDTVIDMGGGNQMILVGVVASSLPPGTIFLG